MSGDRSFPAGPWFNPFPRQRYTALRSARRDRVDVIALMDALSLNRAVLAGYDWGGRAACVAAALWPDRCTGLVSVNSYLIQDIRPARLAQTKSAPRSNGKACRKAGRTGRLRRPVLPQPSGKDPSCRRSPGRQRPCRRSSRPCKAQTPNARRLLASYSPSTVRPLQRCSAAG